MKSARLLGDYREDAYKVSVVQRQAVGNLSGGNQQKVLLSKWMFCKIPEVLILDEPTKRY